MGAQEDWDSRVRTYAAQQLPVQHPGLEDEMLEVPAEELARRLEPESLQVWPDGSFEFWFHDADYQWEHALRVCGTVAGAPNTCIWRAEPMQIILASQSPRRRELLGRMGIENFLVRPAQGEEIFDPTLTPAQLVESLSRQKAEEISAGAGPEDLIIAADTVVSIDGRVLGKPRDPEDAAAMLAALSGREHTVYTGVTVRRGGETVTEHEATAVRFRPLTEEEIADYVATGEPMDKAGAYGIQDYGALLVEGISGDYFNVVGLPVCRLGRILTRFGVDPLARAAEKERKT